MTKQATIVVIGSLRVKSCMVRSYGVPIIRVNMIQIFMKKSIVNFILKNLSWYRNEQLLCKAKSMIELLTTQKLA